MTKANTILSTIAGLLLTALGAAAAYHIWPLLNPEIAERATLNPDCDLNSGPCTVVFSDGARVSFGITPREIPVVTPLWLEVALEGLEAREVEVDFQGTDMNMGYNHVKLKPSAEAGRFSGKAMLPVCVRYVMEWEAKILLHTDRGLLAAPFRFATYSPGGAKTGW